MNEHKDKNAVWRAYTLLCHVAAYEDGTHKETCIPAMNVLLSLLRELGEPVGNDYPDTAPKM